MGILVLFLIWECEYVPEEIYRKIDNYFGEHKHNKNINMDDV